MPIIHIDQLAEQLGVERRWILDNWINRGDIDDAGPIPHFRYGKQFFFCEQQVDEWAKLRANIGRSIALEFEETC